MVHFVIHVREAFLHFMHGCCKVLTVLVVRAFSVEAVNEGVVLNQLLVCDHLQSVDDLAYWYDRIRCAVKCDVTKIKADFKASIINTL